MSAPLLLAVESATTDASVALLRGDAVLAERHAPAERPASEGLLPTLLALLDEAGVALGALDAFAVSIGPGSFTGLRVGVATIKGLAFASAQPVVPVPTLAALALRAARPEACVAALLDARREEVYAALYVGDPSRGAQLGPTVLRADALADALAEHAAGRPIVVIGEGIPVVRTALGDRFGARLSWVLPPEGAPLASAVGRLAQPLLARGAGLRAEAIAPFYVRRAEAEVKRTGTRFEPPPSGLDPL